MLGMFYLYEHIEQNESLKFSPMQYGPNGEFMYMALFQNENMNKWCIFRLPDYHLLHNEGYSNTELLKRRGILIQKQIDMGCRAKEVEAVLGFFYNKVFFGYDHMFIYHPEKQEPWKVIRCSSIDADYNTMIITYSDFEHEVKFAVLKVFLSSTQFRVLGEYGFDNADIRDICYELLENIEDIVIQAASQKEPSERDKSQLRTKELAEIMLCINDSELDDWDFEE